MFVNIDKVIANGKTDSKRIDIWAHTAAEKKSETLKEHTERTEKYFLRLLEERNLNGVIDNFTNIFFGHSQKEIREMFVKNIMNIATFHDMGKINPSYQVNVLKNRQFLNKNIEGLDGNRHSPLSAAIYFDYFMEQLSENDIARDEKIKLQYFVFLNSYVISRHHGDLTSIEYFAQKFEEGGEIYSILEKLNEKPANALYKGPFWGMKDFAKMIERVRTKFYTITGSSDYRQMTIYVYSYVRFLYSLLVASDYYATTEYKNNFELRDYGNIDEIDEINNVYEKTDRIEGIRSFDKNAFDDGKNINVLRNSMFLEAEENLLNNKEKNVFFLEAPTGGGKSNMALNASLKLLDDKTRKIIYVYPFNTLIEQNINSLKDVFGKSSVMEKIAVVNSVNPIKKDEKKWEKIKREEKEKDEEEFYQKVLLDRQFLNYPFVLTTHVNLFEIMFSHLKESAMSFYQLAGSVIVLDEIQSYKNDIWAEIMYFLQIYAKVLNVKVIIMSATLPSLQYLTDIKSGVVNLISDRKKYFEDIRFKGRVKISFELLEKKMTIEELKEHVLKNADTDRNIFIEFIKKASAYDFYDLLKEDDLGELKVHCLTGDYNQVDREKILENIKCSKGNILIATQVIEAGVDIDMDIGYKDISKLDSEEQFLGRINRNYKSKEGIAYFFDMDNEKKIYGNDFRIDSEFIVLNSEMQKILVNKNFDEYYKMILECISDRLNSRLDETGLNEFFGDIEQLNFEAIEKRMKLINEDQWYMSVFVSRNIELQDGSILEGEKVWTEYKELLSNMEMPYSEKQVKLSEVRSKLGYFVYKIKRDATICYNDRIGDLYYWEDGEKYMEDGHLSREKISGECNFFID